MLDWKKADEENPESGSIVLTYTREDFYRVCRYDAGTGKYQDMQNKDILTPTGGKDGGLFEVVGWAAFNNCPSEWRLRRP